MNSYAIFPIEVKRNIRFFGPRKGKKYWRFGMGARWELKRDGSRKILGWSFFIGRYRLIFGARSLLAEMSNY
jgi:hypothetical protein